MEQLTNNIFDTALIFEGGGMRASYTAGFVNTLLEQNMYFDNVYGLSAGSSHTVNYLSRDIWRARASFVDLVNDPKFGGVKTFLTGKGYFSADYIYQEIGLPGGSLVFDMNTFSANPAKATIASFQRDTGKTVYWTKDDLDTLQHLMVRVQSSSTLPFVMPSPEVDGVHYYDGGMGEGAGFMLPKAQADGFTKFFIVRTRPKEYRKPETVSAQDKFLAAWFRKYPHLVEAMATRNKRYNHLADEIEQLEASGAAYVFYAEDQTCESGESNYEKLAHNYDLGYAQAQRELPAMKAFLGL